MRCGNLNLECVYAPNCCNGFKDSREYREMAAHILSLQDQVNGLFNELSHLRTQFAHAPLSMQQQQPPPPQPVPPPLSQPNTAIDPLLQPSYSTPRSQFPSHGPVPPPSPNAARPKSGSQGQPSFRGPTSAEFGFEVATSSLQTMGITSQHEQLEDGNGAAGFGTAEASPAVSPPRRQIVDSWHTDKDPIWKISQEEVLRLCDVYEDEMGLMYPVLDMVKIKTYAGKLYRFMEAAHRTGLMQQGFHGADSIDDEDTNILKLVLATAMIVEGAGQSELGRKMFAFVSPAIDNMLLGSAGVKGIRLLTMAVCGLVSLFSGLR